jgi:transposase
MTEEEIAQLKQANADLKEEVVRKERRIEELEGQLMGALLRIEELERRQAKDSHNSSKPPSSDSLGRKSRKQRKKSDKTRGGQRGHVGHMLQAVENPDQVIQHRASHCEACHCSLSEETGQLKERRQVTDLPELRLQVTEHQVQAICCPECEHITTAKFPEGVNAPAQYGPRLQALTVYLSQYQLLPLERICELLADLQLCQLSQGTVVNWIARASSTLQPWMQTLKELLVSSSLNHVDETGGHIKGLLHWFHVNATKWLTLYSWHRKRGKAAIEAIGILPHYQGRAVHDRLASYDSYPCKHSVCGAHLLRDCLFVAEQEKQPWAQAMFDLLQGMAKATEQWRAQGAKILPKAERDDWVAQYFCVLSDGFAAHMACAPQETSTLPKKTGRRKQDASKNLLDALLKRAEQVLAFLDDLSIPFTNNLAERDLRMIKLQQKISGTFRSEEGATAFCAIRSYLSTMRKQGRCMLEALAAVFKGSPFPVAWQPGT